jgi:hypothetical protein
MYERDPTPVCHVPVRIVPPGDVESVSALS